MTLGMSIQQINPDAGNHPAPADPRELDAALRAAERIWRDIPYFAQRYGERGQRFGRSDSAWLASLAALEQAQVAGQVSWLAGVLAARGMPSMLLAAQLEVLVEELDSAVPEQRDAYAALRWAAAALHEARRVRIADERLDALAERFDAGADEHWRARLPRTGALLGCAVADEHTGYVGAVQSLSMWLSDAQRFSPQWVAQVQRTLHEAREEVGKLAHAGPVTR